MIKPVSDILSKAPGCAAATILFILAARRTLENEAPPSRDGIAVLVERKPLPRTDRRPLHRNQCESHRRGDSRHGDDSATRRAHGLVAQCSLLSPTGI